MRKVAVALVATFVGAAWSSIAAGQALPPSVAAPVREWRACAEHIINEPSNRLTVQLRLAATGLRACSDQQNRTRAALDALPGSEITFEAIERYIEAAVQRAYDARRAAERAAAPASTASAAASASPCPPTAQDVHALLAGVAGVEARQTIDTVTRTWRRGFAWGGVEAAAVETNSYKTGVLREFSYEFSPALYERFIGNFRAFNIRGTSAQCEAEHCSIATDVRAFPTGTLHYVTVEKTRRYYGMALSAENPAIVRMRCGYRTQ